MHHRRVADQRRDLLRIDALLRNNDPAVEMELLRAVYAFLASAAPSAELSASWELLFPAVLLAVGRASQARVHQKSLQQCSASDVFTDWAAYAPQQLSAAQRARWQYLNTLFDVLPLNTRLAAGHVTEAVTQEGLAFLATLHFLNRLRHRMPYLAATQALNQRYVLPALHAMRDSELAALDSYASATALSTYFRRTVACLMLTHVPVDDLLVFDAPEVRTVSPHNFPVGARVCFSPTMELQSVELDGTAVYTRDGLDAMTAVSYARVLCAVARARPLP